MAGLTAPQTAYVTVADLQGYGVRSPDAFGTLSTDQLQNACDAANALADSYLSARFRLPITAWDAGLVQKVIALARFELLVQRGFAPDGDSAAAIVESKNDAVKWFQAVSNGTIKPTVVAGSPASAYVQEGEADPMNEGQFIVGTPSARGW